MIKLFWCPRTRASRILARPGYAGALARDAEFET